MKRMSTFWSFCAFLTLINLVNTQQINGGTCRLPIDPGDCGVLTVLSVPTLRYGYDRASARCIQFTYSGCGGNTNRFSSYNQCLTTCFSSQQIVRIPTCQTNSSTTDKEIDDSGNVCGLPIDDGDCRNESLGADEDSESDSDDVINELYELDDLNKLIDLNELNEHNKRSKTNTFYFGYNKSTKKCEQFNYEGCGGNGNRFETVTECRKTCYTPLKHFLAKVTDLLVFRVTNGNSELHTT